MKSQSDASSLSHLNALFPLDSIEAVVALFRHIVRHSTSRAPDLAFISILLGFFESKMHAQHLIQLQQQQEELSKAPDVSDIAVTPPSEGKDEEKKENEEEKAIEPEFPVLNFQGAEEMYQQFVNLVSEQLKETSDESQNQGLNNNCETCSNVAEPKKASRETINAISDVLWKQLSRNYQKEKTHIQFLYSFLTESKLDSFGVAYGVVAISQLLGLSDVTLALSEDHAWVVFGSEGAENAELTWHARGQDDKRGLALDEGPDVPSSSWLYLNGHPVLCRSPMMAAAAAVTSINPDNCGSQLGSLKRRLLWLLHLEAEESPLQNYPLALLNLADLEAMSPSAPSTPLHCGEDEPGLRSALLRPKPEQLYLQSIEVNRRCYSNQHIYPYTYTAGFFNRVGRRAEALKYWADAAQVMSNYNYFREDEEIYKEFREIAYELLPRVLIQEPPLRHDTSALANVLRFYDGICLWEEGSITPVLHTGWADRFMSTLFKFETATRRELILLDGDEELPLPGVPEPSPEVAEEATLGPKAPEDANSEEKVPETVELPKTPEAKPAPDVRIPPPVTLEQLKAECGRQLFNPAYLLGLVSSPAFLPADHPNPMLELAPLSIRPPSPHQPSAPKRKAPGPPPKSQEPKQPKEPEEALKPKEQPPMTPQTPAKVPALASPSPLTPPHSEPGSSTSNASLSPDLPPAPPSAPLSCLHLRSEKMRGLKALLTGPRLNASAIKLQLTAQSQIYLRRTDLDSAYPLPRKRARRG